MEFGEGILSFIYYETGYTENRKLNPPGSSPLDLEVMVIPPDGYTPCTNTYTNGRYAMILDTTVICRREYRLLLSQDQLKQLKSIRVRIVSPLKQKMD
jgi:hypothetical protein